ncbi:hypothetical protein TKK_0004826 [Trichogramma kaykai]|uniref:peptidylglycine monooxygenase n=1 Tax=Trichogramma kaykai TaxID=54128 RepID=A0ABD2XKF4_9HYME
MIINAVSSVCVLLSILTRCSDAAAATAETADAQVERFPFFMPNVRPNVPESYLCTPVKIDPASTYYITGFEPNATMNTAHHIILYGCGKPGSRKPVWNCGEMAHADPRLASAGPCDEDSEIIYAWARDAPSFILPPDVGFKVGAKSRVKYLVLQVHYAHIDQFADGSTDDSGVTLLITRRAQSKLAGVQTLGTGGSIPPHSVELMEAACKISENKTLHPFAYRTHTHSLGRVVSGYVIKDGGRRWIELGKRDPLTPQMFYETSYRGTVEMGDTLAARCTMRSDRDTWTYVGGTNKDEMCNFYMMYWVENDEPLLDAWCFTPGPPTYYWHKAGLIDIPNDEASTLN